MKRLIPASGIPSAFLIAIGILLLVQEEIDTRTDEQILSYYADSGNRTAELIGFLFVTTGAMLFLVFLGQLRARLHRAEPDPSVSDVGFAAGAVAAGLLVVAAGVLATVSTAAEFSSNFAVDPDLARFGLGAGYLLLIGSVLLSCVLVLATSVSTLRATALPRWLAWVGFAIVPIAIAESFLFPVFAIPVWVLVVSIVLTRQPGPGTQRPLHTDSIQGSAPEQEYAGAS